MRIQSAAAIMLASSLFALTNSAAMAMERQVQINNQTSYTIVEFYASNTGTADWQEDILGSDVLASGSSVKINIDDGDQLVSADNNVCELDTFNFTD